MLELQITLENAFAAINRRSEILFSFELKDSQQKIDVFADLGDGQKVQVLRSALTRTLSNPARCQAVLDACYSGAKKMREELRITTAAIQPKAPDPDSGFAVDLNDFNVEVVEIDNRS